MTDTELRDAASAELKLTTLGWNKVKNYSADKLAASHWGKGLEFLSQISSANATPRNQAIVYLKKTTRGYSSTAMNWKLAFQELAKITDSPAPPPPPPPGDSPYWNEHLDGAYTLANTWSSAGMSDGASISWVPGYQGQGRRVTVAGMGAPGGGGSQYGQLGYFYANADRAYAGQRVNVGGFGEGTPEDTWYRFKVNFPTGFMASPGAGNAFFELHLDERTPQDPNSAGTYSTWLGFQADGVACPGSPPYCTTAANSTTNPRMQLHTAGGPVANPQDLYLQMPPGTFQLNHWYDMVLHMNWNPSPTIGWAQWWVDGVLRQDVHTPTLYTRTDGTLSYGQSIGFYMYRLWSQWSVSVDFDEIMVGPSAASVGFTP